jgi:hypothetical protein
MYSCVVERKNQENKVHSSIDKEIIMTPKEECEELMNSILPFAAGQLEKNGEFFPVGAVMKTEKKIDFTASYDGNERPESKDVIENLVNIHSKLASDGEIIASSIVYDAKLNVNGVVEDAIIVSLEHIDNYSINVAFPYKKIRKLLMNKIEFYEPINIEGSKNIF